MRIVWKNLECSGQNGYKRYLLLGVCERLGVCLGVLEGCVGDTERWGLSVGAPVR